LCFLSTARRPKTPAEPITIMWRVRRLERACSDRDAGIERSVVVMTTLSVFIDAEWGRRRAEWLPQGADLFATWFADHDGPAPRLIDTDSPRTTHAVLDVELALTRTFDEVVVCFEPNWVHS
jgi:hypothetical protein